MNAQYDDKKKSPQDEYPGKGINFGPIEHHLPPYIIDLVNVIPESKPGSIMS
jgi:hypothetical protein